MDHSCEKVPKSENWCDTSFQSGKSHQLAGKILSKSKFLTCDPYSQLWLYMSLFLLIYYI